MHTRHALNLAALAALAVALAAPRPAAAQAAPGSAKGAAPVAAPSAQPSPPAAGPADVGLSSEDAALDGGAPPPGRPSDVALWKAARKVNVDVILVRKEAADLQQRASNAKLLKRLEAAATATPSNAAALGEARKRLDAAWQENYALRTRPWPINTIRVCNQPLLVMDSGMRAAAADRRRESAVDNARPPLKTCVDRATLAVKSMAASNDALRAAIGGAEAALAEAPAAKVN